MWTLEDLKYQQAKLIFNPDFDLYPNIFQNCYLGIFAEMFLILTLSLLIAFLVIIDYYYNHKLLLTNISGKILVIIYLLMAILINNNNSHFLVFGELLIIDNF